MATLETAAVADEDQIPEEYQNVLTARGFVLKGVIGRGATGRVFLARQQSLKRDVAVKFCDNSESANNPQVRARFVQEAGLLAIVASPHVPYVLTSGTVGSEASGTPYFVMQLLPGERLDEVLSQRGGKLPVDVAVSYTRQVLAALTVAHQKKIIHRDVKPANILVSGDHVHLLDFSIGVQIDHAAARITGMAQRLGTSTYAAPEQRSNARDVREMADIWACGLVLFEMLVGHPAIESSNLDRELASVPVELKEAICKACSTKPEDRYARAADFAAALAAITPQRLRMRAAKGLALCLNPLCSRTGWSDDYEGPAYEHYPDCTGNHCEYCGQKMTYECSKCGTPVNGKPFCGMCGEQVYGDPKCDVCNGILRREEVEGDTGVCRRCSHSRYRVTQLTRDPLAVGGYIPSDPGDDDVPF